MLSHGHPKRKSKQNRHRLNSFPHCLIKIRRKQVSSGTYFPRFLLETRTGAEGQPKKKSASRRRLSRGHPKRKSKQNRHRLNSFPHCLVKIRKTQVSSVTYFPRSLVWTRTVAEGKKKVCKSEKVVSWTPQKKIKMKRASPEQFSALSRKDQKEAGIICNLFPTLPCKDTYRGRRKEKSLQVWEGCLMDTPKENQNETGIVWTSFSALSRKDQKEAGVIRNLFPTLPCTDMYWGERTTTAKSLQVWDAQALTWFSLVMTLRSSWRRRFSCMAMSRPRLASCKSSLMLSTWRRRLLISRSFSDRLSLAWLQCDSIFYNCILFLNRSVFLNHTWYNYKIITAYFFQFLYKIIIAFFFCFFKITHGTTTGS